jgi:hypothetical protein
MIVSATILVPAVQASVCRERYSPGNDSRLEAVVPVGRSSELLLVNQFLQIAPALFSLLIALAKHVFQQLLSPSGWKIVSPISQNRPVVIESKPATFMVSKGFEVSWQVASH